MVVEFLKTSWRTLSKPLLMCSTAFSRYFPLLCQFWIRSQPSSICFLLIISNTFPLNRKLLITFFTPTQDQGWYMISTSNISIFLVAFLGRYFLYLWFSVFLNSVQCHVKVIRESYTVLFSVVTLLRYSETCKLCWLICRLTDWVILWCDSMIKTSDILMEYFHVVLCWQIAVLKIRME